MTLPDDYLRYPMRRHGMDHDLYPVRYLKDAAPVKWPNGATVAVWITLSLEYFPLDPGQTPFRAPGHMVTPYPDYRTYTVRDYGNRVGAFRVIDRLNRHGLKASVPLCAAVAERCKPLVNELLARGDELIAHGADMNALHYGGMDEAAERAQIGDALDRIEAATGVRPIGWLSPGRSQSANTPKLLSEAGVRYGCDWGNDDMPYDQGDLVAMPFTTELEDRLLLSELGQSEADWTGQISDAYDWLAAEAARTGSGRILHVALTPYIIGQPFRIAALDDLFARLKGKPGMWNATGAEILEAWKS